MAISESKLDPRTFAYIHTLMQAATLNDNWKAAFDKLLVALRAEFVFDNVVAYQIDDATQLLEVVHARAVGRGKSAEADAAWGEEFANKVLSRRDVIIQMPDTLKITNDRLSEAHLLGLPIYMGTRINGALIFVRFGGPAYQEEHVMLARLAQGWVGYLLEKRAWLETKKQFDTLQQKVQLQDDFVATISHELRTPLGFIKGYSTTLLRSDTIWDDETRQEFLTIIDEEADRLAELIDNILESAKLQSRTLQLEFQPLRLDALVRDVVVRVRTRRKDIDIELDLAPLPPIKGDNVRLAQVFDNLFSNALKYAPGAKIAVKIENESDASVLVTFTDTGPGIPEAYLPYIFERFYRVPGERSVKGSGLGLYICNQIIQAHHGKIWVDSKLDEGTNFYIQLPVDPTH